MSACEVDSVSAGLLVGSWSANGVAGAAWESLGVAGSRAQHPRLAGPLTDLRPGSEQPNTPDRRKTHLKNTTMMQTQREPLFDARGRAASTEFR